MSQALEVSSPPKFARISDVVLHRVSTPEFNSFVQEPGHEETQLYNSTLLLSYAFGICTSLPHLMVLSGIAWHVYSRDFFGVPARRP